MSTLTLQIFGLAIGVVLVGGIVGVLLLLRPIVELLRTVARNQNKLRRRQDEQALVFNELLARIASRTAPRNSPDDPEGDGSDAPTRPRLRIVRDTTAGLVLAPFLALGTWFVRHPMWVAGFALTGLLALISGPLMSTWVPGGATAIPPTVTRSRVPRTPARSSTTPTPTAPVPGPTVIPSTASVAPAQEVVYGPYPASGTTSARIPPSTSGFLTPPANPPPTTSPPSTPPPPTGQPAACLDANLLVLDAHLCLG